MTATARTLPPPLPSPATLAALVTRVTETMIGMSLSVASDRPALVPWEEIPKWRTVLLPIPGKRHVTVAVAADEATGKVIGGRMFSVAPGEVDESMLVDTLCELANIIAGQVKSAMALDQALGLPQVLPVGSGVDGAWRSAVLSPGQGGGGQEQLFWVAITEK